MLICINFSSPCNITEASSTSCTTETWKCPLCAPVTWCAPRFLRSGSVPSCAGRRERPSLCRSSVALSPQPSREDERIRVWASSAALRPPCLRLNELTWSDVSPPSVIWERMRLLVLATLLGVLFDAGECELGETATPFFSPCVRAQC